MDTDPAISTDAALQTNDLSLVDSAAAATED